LNPTDPNAFTIIKGDYTSNFACESIFDIIKEN